MAKTLEEIIQELPAKRRVKIEEGTKRIQAEYAALEDLRALLGRNRSEIAAYLEISLDELKQYECIADRYAAAAQEVLEDLGGSLEMTVRTPDNKVVQVERITDLMPQPIYGGWLVEPQEEAPKVPEKKSRQA